MIRVLIDIAIDTDPLEQVNVQARLDRFIEDLRGTGAVSVARADVTASPDPDQAEADMVEAFRGRQ